MKRKGCLYLFFAIFAIAGLGCGVAGFWLVKSRYDLVNNGIKTTGTVIDLNHSKNNVAPIVGFNDEWGNSQVYSSTNYTSLESFEIGQKITIYYDPANPENATLDGEGWWSWFPFIFLFTHGGVGLGGLYWLEKKRRLHQWLQQSGHEVQAKFTGIKDTYNKGRYYSVQCDWTDPYTNVLYTFESDSTSNDPTGLIAQGSKVRVLIDPNNPKRYWMDTAFLEG
ncbi:MAG: DUF3592 domain-containing protein [Saprospiraceae bacterium]